MSYVTNVLLCCSLVDDPGWNDKPSPAIEAVNRWLADNAYSEGDQLANLDKDAGGHRGMECRIWGGAFNHLLVPEFIEAVRSAPWGHAIQTVQLFIKEQEDEIFTERLHAVPELEDRFPPPPRR